MKRIVTIQDISCVGKCSLTVALPIISAAGVETSVIPTAVLSTHTAFNNFTFKDLTNEIDNISDVFKKENITFDAIYTGYLGSYEQIKIVSKFFDDYKTEENLILIDPVMGDYGNFYSGFDKEFASKMAELCAKADIIMPNMTEAAFLLNIPYKEEYDEEYVQYVLKELCKLGAKKAVLTGVNYIPEKLGVISYDAETKTYFSYFNEKIKQHFHGTGDIFASSCTGALMNNLSLDKSLEISANFTAECIRQTVADSEHRTYGVNFETALPYYINEINDKK